MNNFDIIKTVEEISWPYFKFNIADFYGDKGSCKYPDISELKLLPFKLNGNARAIQCTKNTINQLIQKIKDLNISTIKTVDYMRIMSVGMFIIVSIDENADAFDISILK